MDWYKLIFEVIDLRSFSNLWYWIMLGVVWSASSHWVMGVPYDMIGRARRQGGQAAEDLALLVRIKSQRLRYIAETAGLWLIGIVAFGLTTLLILSLAYDIEFATALLCLVGPMALVMALSMRQARIILDTAPEGEALIHRLMRHRMATQMLGMVVIFVTSLIGMWHNLQIGHFG